MDGKVDFGWRCLVADRGKGVLIELLLAATTSLGSRRGCHRVRITRFDEFQEEEARLSKREAVSGDPTVECAAKVFLLFARWPH